MLAHPRRDGGGISYTRKHERGLDAERKLVLNMLMY